MICDSIKAVAEDIINWKSKLDPEDFKKRLLGLLQKLQTEGFVAFALDQWETLLNVIRNNKIHARHPYRGLIDEEEFAIDKEEFLAIMIDDDNDDNLFDMIMDMLIAKVAATEPKELISTFDDLLLSLSNIANNVRDLDPQESTFEVDVFTAILAHTGGSFMHFTSQNTFDFWVHLGEHLGNHLVDWLNQFIAA